MMAEAASVLVAVDGSASAFGAARWAALEAKAHRRPLVIVASAQLPIPRSAEMLGEGSAAGAIALATATRTRCEAAVAKAVEISHAVLAPGHEVRTEIWEGPPIPLLLEKSHTVGMMVLGDRGLGDSPVIGSVAEAVTAHGHCPVVVVREWRGTEGGFGDGPIVVGVDGSTHCEAAIGLAMSEAAERGARVIAVHAWSDVPLDGAVASIGAEPAGIDWSSFQQRHDAALAEVLAGWQERFPDVQVERVVVNDRPVRHLLAAANDAQLLVVGRQGRGGFTGMMVGSTSRALLHTAPCPLVIVRPADPRRP
ncbi:universal stress protein [Tomitella biformata]|uniref:universal stress protein n=1 Tax=Tomitella biformata TaxID=630403 RepID=UPI0004BA89D2|nr:universal stress protein [Tomitella biformata]